MSAIGGALIPDYAKAQHGFHNDSTSRYSPKDAELAWRRTVDFFDSHLK